VTSEAQYQIGGVNYAALARGDPTQDPGIHGRSLQGMQELACPPNKSDGILIPIYPRLGDIGAYRKEVKISRDNHVTRLEDDDQS
jgi:hypothetical protein